ncbi:hypothetical protein BLNAU_12670 [Blattamonas nauphoetae]|uniref:MIF4G domain-containing protein n=1 Tax=Blattamonas nauphoetae TaxID=2049346 RepID=A0ABQ9XIZ4_9EUKA|nr:hypothetical protein BLNAU_12670 [Blattamonas nauphoetae]
MNYPYEHGPHQPPQPYGYPMMTPMAPQVMMPMGSPMYPQGYYQNTQILAPPAPLQDPTMSLQDVIHQTGGFVPTFKPSSDKDPIQTATIDRSRAVAAKTFKPKGMKSNQPQSVPDPIDLSQVSNSKPFIPKPGAQLPATDKSKDISLEHNIDSTAPKIFKPRSQTSPTKNENQPTPQISAPSQPKQPLVPQNDQVIVPSVDTEQSKTKEIEEQKSAIALPTTVETILTQPEPTSDSISTPIVQAIDSIPSKPESKEFSHSSSEPPSPAPTEIRATPQPKPKKAVIANDENSFPDIGGLTPSPTPSESPTSGKKKNKPKKEKNQNISFLPPQSEIPRLTAVLTITGPSPTNTNGTVLPQTLQTSTPSQPGLSHPPSVFTTSPIQTPISIISLSPKATLTPYQPQSIIFEPGPSTPQSHALIAHKPNTPTIPLNDVTQGSSIYPSLTISEISLPTQTLDLFSESTSFASIYKKPKVQNIDKNKVYPEKHYSFATLINSIFKTPQPKRVFPSDFNKTELAKVTTPMNAPKQYSKSQQGNQLQPKYNTYRKGQNRGPSRPKVSFFFRAEKAWTGGTKETTEQKRTRYIKQYLAEVENNNDEDEEFKQLDGFQRFKIREKEAEKMADRLLSLDSFTSKIRLLLNKLNPKHYDKLFIDFRDNLFPDESQQRPPPDSENEDDSEIIEDRNERFNRAVLEIYDKAVYETKYVKLYADLCKQLADYEQQLPHSSPPDSPSLRMSVVPTTFRKCLVDKVSTTLKQYAAKSVQDPNSSLRQLQTPSPGTISAPNPSPSPTSELASPSPTPALTATPTRTSDNSAVLERLEARGNVLFIGYLIANDLISTREGAPCLAALWEGTTPQNVIEENVEAVSTFLIVTGKRIQKEAPEAIEKNMNKLNHLIKHGNITPQCKYKLMEAVYARDRNWEPQKPIVEARSVQSTPARSQPQTPMRQPSPTQQVVPQVLSTPQTKSKVRIMRPDDTVVKLSPDENAMVNKIVGCAGESIAKLDYRFTAKLEIIVRNWIVAQVKAMKAGEKLSHAIHSELKERILSEEQSSLSSSPSPSPSPRPIPTDAAAAASQASLITVFSLFIITQSSHVMNAIDPQLLSSSPQSKQPPATIDSTWSQICLDGMEAALDAASNSLKTEIKRLDNPRRVFSLIFMNGGIQITNHVLTAYAVLGPFFQSQPTKHKQDAINDGFISLTDNARLFLRAVIEEAVFTHFGSFVLDGMFDGEQISNERIGERIGINIQNMKRPFSFPTLLSNVSSMRETDREPDTATEPITNSLLKFWPPSTPPPTLALTSISSFRLWVKEVTGCKTQSIPLSSIFTSLIPSGDKRTQLHESWIEQEAFERVQFKLETLISFEARKLCAVLLSHPAVLSRDVVLNETPSSDSLVFLLTSLSTSSLALVFTARASDFCKQHNFDSKTINTNKPQLVPVILTTFAEFILDIPPPTATALSLEQLQSFTQHSSFTAKSLFAAALTRSLIQFILSYSESVDTLDLSKSYDESLVASVFTSHYGFSRALPTPRFPPFFPKQAN